MLPDTSPHLNPSEARQPTSKQSLDDLVSAMLGTKYEALLIDNDMPTQKNSHRDIYFFKVDKDRMKLEIKKEMSKHVIECDLKTHALMVNGRAVERSLYSRFSQKVDLMVRDVEQGRAKIEFKKVRGGF